MNAPSPVAAPPARLSDADPCAILVGVMLAMFLGALDQTIVATALPTIGRELGDVQSLSWVVTAYLLTSTVVTPIYGKLSDIHGRRVDAADRHRRLPRSARSPAPCAGDIFVLIAARALQGLGGGGLISLAPDDHRRHRRRRASAAATRPISPPCS